MHFLIIFGHLLDVLSPFWTLCGHSKPHNFKGQNMSITKSGIFFSCFLRDGSLVLSCSLHFYLINIFYIPYFKVYPNTTQCWWQKSSQLYKIIINVIHTLSTVGPPHGGPDIYVPLAVSVCVLSATNLLVAASGTAGQWRTPWYNCYKMLEYTTLSYCALEDLVY